MTTSPKIQDLDAERAVLGAVLIDPRSIAVALDVLSSADFTGPRESPRAHQFVFLAMRHLAQAGSPIDTIDTVSIAGHLEKRGELSAVGGIEGLLDLPRAVASAANVEHHARRVRDCARLRRFVAKVGAIASDAGAALDPAEFLRNAQSTLLGLTEEDSRDGLVTAHELAIATVERLEQDASSETPPALEVGIQAFDDAQVLRPGSLVVLAGRPGMGKSALAGTIALNAAEAGERVLFVSLEMAPLELSRRWTAMRANIDASDFDRPKELLNSPAYERVDRALAAFADLDLTVWEASRLTIEGLRVRAQRVHRLRPLSLLIVDYLGLMRGEAGDRGRVEEVTSISRGLKNLAKELRCPVLALSQLSRECERRSPPIPVLSDLRDSGSVEQDADAVIFLYRPAVYRIEGYDESYTELLLEKHRLGKPGRFFSSFDMPHQLFDRGRSIARPVPTKRKGASHPGANGHTAPGEAHE